MTRIWREEKIISFEFFEGVKKKFLETCICYKKSTLKTWFAWKEENERRTFGGGKASHQMISPCVRFRRGDRFWSQVLDTCRQALRDRNVGP